MCWAAERGPEEGDKPDGVVEPVGRRADERDHDKYAPEPEDHARNRGQHLDQRAEGDRDPGRQEILSQEDRDPDPDEPSDQQGEERTIEGSERII